MNTQNPDILRAMELQLQARNEPLEAADREWLDAYLETNPEVASEGASLTGFMDHLQGARVSVSETHRAAMKRSLEDLVREDVLARPVVSATPSPIRRGLAFLFGRDEGGTASRKTILVARGLAMYLGVMAVVCVYLAIKSPDRPPARVAEPESVTHTPHEQVPTPSPVAPSRPR